MARYSNKGFEDIDISKAELKQIGEALKKEEFRKLLNDYVEEVNDPKNRAIYEKELTQLEKERGVDITFVHPQPGYVIKSSVDGVQKVFLNICSNDKIDKPVSVKRIKDGVQGSDWSIPHVITPSKVDLDKKGQRCVVYDIVFHPDTLEIARKSAEFRGLVNDTAISGIEDSFKTKIDRNNIKFPKMGYKGPKLASIMRKQSNDLPDKNIEVMEIPNYPYEPLKSPRSPKIIKPRKNKCENSGQPNYTTPEYIIKHRKGVDLQEFTNIRDSKMNATVPSEIVVEIDLPLLSSTEDAILDVSPRRLSLVSEKPSKYKLDINLPYPVDEVNGSAKFDKKSKKLIVTLPVNKKFDSSYFSRDDSGIESDPSQNRSSSDEDLSCPPVEVISSSGPVTEDDISENTLRTSGEVCGEFLSDKLHYSLPSFDLINYRNCLTVTLNIKNVNPATVEHQYISDSGIHFKFSSLGSGCFPIYYAICFQFPGFSINNSSLKVEVWDNNLILNIEVSSKNREILKSYLFGTCASSLISKEVPLTAVEHNEIKEDETTKEIEEKICEISFEEPVKEIPSPIESQAKVIGDVSITVNSEDLNNNAPEKPSGCTVKKLTKVRTSSESNAHSPNLAQLAYRSILKTSRSLSESHSDEYMNWSSLDSSDIISEDSSCQPVKKTVRFSDVISKKIFRANSSILGQKHKNEKKSRNRKKVARRRMSESENSEVSDFSDYSEVSDLSDVSETSDASSDDQPSSSLTNLTQLPSGKHHRRRGSKNRRKNAATAKQNNFILSQD